MGQCLIGDIILANQNQVDSFRINYGCDTILGNLFIAGGDIFTGEPFASTDIYSLDSLLDMRCIIGSLAVYNNDSLSTLSGLDNLDHISGGLFVEFNDRLTGLVGLEALDTIAGAWIRYNSKMQNLEGLEGINYIESDLLLEGSISTDFMGLNNLKKIGGNLEIRFNESLADFAGLENLEDIDGNFILLDNDSITSLVGLTSLAIIGGDLMISKNALLGACSIEAICQYLQNPGGNSVAINQNKQGCNSRWEIDAGCGQCPTGELHLSSQNQVDSFPIMFPNCDSIKGDLIIEKPASFSDISNLDSLTYLKFIGGHLRITSSNIQLIGLSGLENLIAIDGSLDISIQFDSVGLKILKNLKSVGNNIQLRYCTGLESLSGLEHLDTIVGLSITECDNLSDLRGLDSLVYLRGQLSLWGNDRLTNLEGLNKVTTIPFGLRIIENDSLSSLDAIQNLDSIGRDLYIYGNDMLTECAIEAVCSYLNSPPGISSIHSNKANCSSIDAIKSACSSCPDCFSVDNYWTGNALNSNWNDEGNWDLGIPSECHKVIISQGAEIAIDGPAICYTLNVEIGATLIVDQVLQVACGDQE